MKKEKIRQNRIYISFHKSDSKELEDAKIDALYRAIRQQIEDWERSAAKLKQKKKR